MASGGHNTPDLSGPANSPILFWSVCIPLRLFLAFLPSVLERSSAPWKAYVSLLALIGTGLLVFATARSQGWIAARGFGGQYAYWDSYIHGVLYLFAAYYILDGRPRLAQIVLLADVFVGIGQVLLMRPK